MKKETVAKKKKCITGYKSYLNWKKKQTESSEMVRKRELF